MTAQDDAPSPLDALSDAEYDARVTEAVGTLMEAVETAMDSDDEVEAELLYAAAPTAMRNILAQLLAEQCLGQPKPFKLVKELIRDLDLERLSLALLKEIQAEEGEAGQPD
jgi:hypothetical protein